jgi:hypothetical protein
MPYMYTMAEIKKQGFKKIEVSEKVVKHGEPPKFIE